MDILIDCRDFVNPVDLIELNRERKRKRPGSRAEKIQVAKGGLGVGVGGVGVERRHVLERGYLTEVFGADELFPACTVDRLDIDATAFLADDAVHLTFEFDDVGELSRSVLGHALSPSGSRQNNLALDYKKIQALSMA